MNTIECNTRTSTYEVSTRLYLTEGCAYYGIKDTLGQHEVCFSEEDLEWLLSTIREHKQWVRNTKGMYEL